MSDITEPGIYEMPEADYHADPAPISLSSSIIKILVEQTPAHARLAHPRINPEYKEKTSSVFDIGSAAHCLALQDEPKIDTLDFKDWRTAAAKEAKAAAYEAGHIPLLAHEYDRVIDMVSELIHQLRTFDPDLLDHTREDTATEQTVIWDEPVPKTDRTIKARARIDWLRRPPSGSPLVFADYKTTGRTAHPRHWPRLAYNLGYDIQAEWYTRGLRATLGGMPECFFVVQETEPPYAVQVFGVSEAASDYASRRIDKAVALWDRCLQSKKWPGYTGGIEYIAPADWMMREAENERLMEETE